MLHRTYNSFANGARPGDVFYRQDSTSFSEISTGLRVGRLCMSAGRELKERLVATAPVDSGVYASSFRVTQERVLMPADGSFRPEWRLGALVSNDAPYARALDAGHRAGNTWVPGRQPVKKLLAELRVT